MYSFFYRIIKSTIIRVLFLYKRHISPLLPNACRFQPSCSEYMIEAINEHGIIKGVYLGFIRICKCNPLGPSGYDPVPKSKKNKPSIKQP